MSAHWGIWMHKVGGKVDHIATPDWQTACGQSRRTGRWVVSVSMPSVHCQRCTRWAAAQ